MKRTITSLMVMLCAILVTSFVLPADQKKHASKKGKKFDDVYIEITNGSNNSQVSFQVDFMSLTTHEHYTFDCMPGLGTSGGLPIDTYQISLNATSSEIYRLDACWDYAYSFGGKSINSMQVGPDGIGCNQFYISYHPNP